MIIDRKELLAAEELLAFVEKFFSRALDEDSPGTAVPPVSTEFFAHCPHLLLPLGFNEYRVVLDPEEEKRLYQEYAKEREEFKNYHKRSSPERRLRPYKNLPRKSPADVGAFDYLLESYYRDEKTGAWFWFDGIERKRELHFVFRGPGGIVHSYDTRAWLSVLRKAVDTPLQNPHTLYLPKLWTPSAQLEQLALTGSIPVLLESIQKEQRSLREIPWRQLEEIVAEILRSKGLEIFVTPRSRDGGRDIVARGELVPGEPTTLAVEVKQKPVVGLADLQRAIKANEDFPALLLATAGRFSAGVIQERKRRRHELRLLLKDGIALRQWIDMYIRARDQVLQGYIQS